MTPEETRTYWLRAARNIPIPDKYRSNTSDSALLLSWFLFGVDARGCMCTDNGGWLKDKIRSRLPPGPLPEIAEGAFSEGYNTQVCQLCGQLGPREISSLSEVAAQTSELK